MTTKDQLTDLETSAAFVGGLAILLAVTQLA